MRFADTELDPANVPACCAENFADFRERVEDTEVDYAQELICPTCGGALVLDSDSCWRYAGTE